MRVVVVSSAPVIVQESEKFLYAPYEKEMQLWAKYADEILLCCPVWKEDKKLLVTKVTFPMLPAIELKEFDVLSLKNAVAAIPTILQNLGIIYKAMQQADHIHLICLIRFLLLRFPVIQKKRKNVTSSAFVWHPRDDSNVRPFA